jgi:hypothetical protein
MIITLESKKLDELIYKMYYTKFVKAGKPCHVYYTGKSGEGKSYKALKDIEIISQKLEIDLNPKHITSLHIIYDFEDFEKVCKHVFFSDCELPVVAMMEGSVLAHARQFMSKKNIAIGRIMSLSRTIKPVVFLLCSQHWNDLDVALRRRLDYFIPVIRYVSSEGKSTKPVAKPYFISHGLTELILSPVYIYYKPAGVYYRLQGITFSMPDKELIKEFEKKERSKKRELIDLTMELE